jgi:hypothetical protein
MESNDPSRDGDAGEMAEASLDKKIRVDLFAVIERLLDSSAWPTYTNYKMLGELGSLAGAAFKGDTFDGYLGYVLIAHQLDEDYVLLLLRHIQFTLRLNILQNGFGWPSSPYDTPGGKKKKAMLGSSCRILSGRLDLTASASSSTHVANRMTFAFASPINCSMG